MEKRRTPEIIAGRVQTNGNLYNATVDGVTATRTGTGVYTVSLPPGFRIASAVANGWGNQAWFAAVSGYQDDHSFTVSVVNTAGTPIDNQFSFVAVGLQQ